MAKTYTLQSTAMHCGYHSTIPSGYWSGFNGSDSVGMWVGMYRNNYRLVNIMFNQSDLASLRSKTVTSIKLTLTFASSATIYGSSDTKFPIGYKLNSTATTESAGDAWTRSNAASTEASATTIGYIRSSGSQYTINANESITLDLTGTSVPVYGYVLGTYSGSGYAYNITNSATLTVVTNETDYTLKLSYNGNGGSGAPSAQTATVTTTGTPSYTFTIPNTTPTRTGYTFLGWATSASATTAAYHGGDTYTITSNKTLYAVWQIITYTVSYKKGSYGTGTNTTDTKTYGVNLTLKAAIFTRTGYAQDGWSTTDGGSKAYALAGTYSANAAITLYPYWKVTSSTISASNGTIGSAIAITITRASSAYTHTVSYAFGSATGTIGTNIGTSVSWTPDMSLCSQIPSAGSGQCVLTCTTYQGTTLIGSSTKTITLSVPSAVKCTVTSVALAETVTSPNIASQFSDFVQNKSKVSVTATTSTANAYGATVAAYSIAINGQVLTTNGAVTTALATAGSNSYTVTITDTRGRTDTYTNTFTVLAYVSPSSTVDAERDSGTNTTINVSYGWTISACNDLNTKQVRIRYRLSNDYWTTATTITPATYSGTATYAITGTDANGQYEVQVQVTDFFTTINSAIEVSSIGDRLLYYSASDMTIAKHDENPKDGWDHQFFKEKFHDDVSILGSLSVPHGLVFKGVASDTSTNFNNITTAGVYICNATTMSNGPAYYTWSYLLVFTAATSGFITQYIIRSAASDVLMYVRSYGGNPAAWRSWCSPLQNSYGDLWNAGNTLSDAPSAVNVATATWKTVASISMTAGRWVVFGNARFASNATGYREILLSSSADDSTQAGYIWHDIRNAVNGTYTYCSFSCWRTLNSAAVQYLNAYQNSGSSLSTIGRLYAMQIC